MRRVLYKGSEILLFITAMFFSPACDLQSPFDYKEGILKGIISIGPLCPVETVPPQLECLPTAETYKAYPVSVWTTDMKTKVLDLSPSIEGYYSVTLPEGQFLVVLKRPDPGAGGSNLPESVVIADGLTTTLNINIDTGIR